MLSSTDPLVSSLDASELGSSSASPSRLPRILVEYQPSTWSARPRNAGASTVLTRVWPVLPSLPAIGTPLRRASSFSAGISAETLGVKLPYGMPLGDRGVGIKHRRADLLVVGVQRHLERFRRRELRQAGIDQTLGRGEMDDHEAIDAAIRLEAPQIVLEAVDLVAHRGQVGALPSRDIAAELDVADGGPGPDRLQFRPHEIEFGGGQDSVLAAGGCQIVRIKVPPGQSDVLVGCQAGLGGISQRQSGQIDSPTADHSQPGGNRRRNRSAQPDYRNAQTACRHLTRCILRDCAGHGRCGRQTLLNCGNGQWSGYQTGTFANRREDLFMWVTHIFK